MNWFWKVWTVMLGVCMVCFGIAGIVTAYRGQVTEAGIYGLSVLVFGHSFSVSCAQISRSR